MTTIMYVSAILAVVIILTIIGVLSRYRRCKPNQVKEWKKSGRIKLKLINKQL